MKIAIIGAGAYAIALTKMFEKNTKEITIWTKFKSEMELLNKTRENSKALPNIIINKETKVTTDLEEALRNSKVIVIAIPTAYIRETLKNMKPYLTGKEIILNASKGIENRTLKLIHQIVNEELKTLNYANISGPTIAKDMAENETCSLTLASKDKKIIKTIKELLENDTLTLSLTKDVIGTEICGAVKNTFAIQSGIIAGQNDSISTKSKYLTESFNALKEVVYNLKGNKKTVDDYAGIGDLIMTSTAPSGRNYTLGYMIGSGMSKQKIFNFISSNTVEGLYTLQSIKEILDKNKIKNEIINNLYNKIKDINNFS